MSQLFGLDAAARALGKLFGGDRRPSGLILHGPEQIGKAQLAERLADALLAGKSLPDVMAAPSSLVVQRAHPDLCWVARTENDRGQLRTQITIDQIQKLLSATQQTASLAPVKVAVIDEAERMNLSAANALLKRLEEPTGNAVFILVTGALGRLLPTIRSRAQTLAVPSLSRDAFAEWQAASGQNEANLFELSGGAPGRALALQAGGLTNLMQRLTAVSHRLEIGEARKLAQTIAGLSTEQKALVRQFQIDRLAAKAKQTALNGGDAAQALEAYDAAREVVRNADRLNLDEQSVWVRLLCA